MTSDLLALRMTKSGIDCSSLAQLQYVQNNTATGLYSGINKIRDYTNRSGDVGPVVFDRLPTWWIKTSAGVSERFPVCRSGFLDESRLFHVGLVDYKRFPL